MLFITDFFILIDRLTILEWFQSFVKTFITLKIFEMLWEKQFYFMKSFHVNENVRLIRSFISTMELFNLVSHPRVQRQRLNPAKNTFLKEFDFLLYSSHYLRILCFVSLMALKARRDIKWHGMQILPMRVSFPISLENEDCPSQA